MTDGEPAAARFVDGVDAVWALVELDKFIDFTRPHNLSGDGLITLQNGPAKESAAKEQWVAVHAILDRVHPEWRNEHPEDDYFDFGQRREAAIYARAHLQRLDEIAAHVDPAAPTLSADSLHPWVWAPAAGLWRDGHHRAAVATSGAALDARLQDLTGRREVTGRALVLEVLSDRPAVAGKPRLRVPDQGNDESTASAQQGLRALGEAAFQLVRNLSTHTLNDLTEQEGLERLAVLSLFARLIDECRKEIADTDAAVVADAEARIDRD